MITLMPSSILLDLLQSGMEKCVHQSDLPFVISHLRCHCRKLGINFPAGRERRLAPCLPSRHGADGVQVGTDHVAFTVRILLPHLREDFWW